MQLFGTNWQLLERILPGRPRRALRNKFRAEQRREPARMDAALAGTPSSLENYRQIIRILQARADPTLTLPYAQPGESPPRSSASCRRACAWAALPPYPPCASPGIDARATLSAWVRQVLLSRRPVTARAEWERGQVVAH